MNNGFQQIWAEIKNLWNYAFALYVFSVCRAIVDEVSYSIGKVDPKKTIQVGSFRVDSKGNQDTYKVLLL